jgi:hypothetical protein
MVRKKIRLGGMKKKVFYSRSHTFSFLSLRGQSSDLKILFYVFRIEHSKTSILEKKIIFFPQKLIEIIAFFQKP